MMAARNEFDTDLDDAEQGASGSNVQINQAEFETPIGSTLRQVYLPTIEHEPNNSEATSCVFFPPAGSAGRYKSVR